MNETAKAVAAAAAQVNFDPNSQESQNASKFYREALEVCLEDQELDEVGGASNHGNRYSLQ